MLIPRPRFQDDLCARDRPDPSGLPCLLPEILLLEGLSLKSFWALIFWVSLGV